MDVARDLGGVLYEVPVVPLTRSAVHQLEQLARQEDSQDINWYLTRRSRALRRVGIVAASWSETLHPRGHDGRFISKFGLVRWLANGKWQQGEVVDITDDGGGKPRISVKWDGKGDPPHNVDVGFDTKYGSTLEFTNPKMLWAKPKPKALLNLPNPTGSGDDGWKKTGGQGGSNPGGFFQMKDPDMVELGSPWAKPENFDVPEVGDEFYVKKAKSPEHAHTEALAGTLYEMAGVAVPKVTVNESASRIASKIVKSDNEQTLSSLLQNPSDPANAELLSQIRSDLVVDAWLSNWDVVGMTFDNMKIVDGTPVRLDAGGALTFRAMGSPKGALFGNEASEITTLRSPMKAAQASKVFKATTDAELRDGATRVAAIDPQDIKDAVLDEDLPPSLSDKLIARRSWLLKYVGVEDPYESKSAVDAPKPKLDPYADDVHAPAYTDPGSIPKAKPAPSAAETAEVWKTETAIPDPKPTSTPTPPQKVASAPVKPDSNGPVVSTSGVSNRLPVAEDPITTQQLAGMKQEDAEAMIGRTFVVNNPTSVPKDKVGGYQTVSGYGIHLQGWITSQVGMGTVTEVRLPGKGESGSTYNGRISLITQNGMPMNVTIPHPDSPYDKTHSTFTPIDIALKPHPPATLRKDGAIVYGGEVVGKFSKKYKSVMYEIDKKYSVFGEKTNVNKNGGISYSKKEIGNFIISPKQLELTPKVDVPEHDKVHEAVVAAKIDSPTAGQTVDGKPAMVGLWVVSTKDGKIGKIVKVPNQEKYPGHTQVELADGTKVSRNVKFLKSTEPPEGESNPAMPASMYTDLKLGDGNAPAVGQKVIAGKGGKKEITGTITKFKAADGGWMEVKDDASGKKMWRKLSTGTLVEEAPGLAPQSEKDVKLGAAIVATSPSSPTVKVPRSGSIKFPAKGGKTIKQNSEIAAQWADDGRNPTKDGYAPTLGMQVRDNKGNKFVVVGIKDKYAANSSSVRLYDPATKDLKWKNASALFVDHEAELTDAKGDPISVVAAVTSGTSDPQAPDGSYVYRFSTLKYDYDRKQNVEATAYAVVRSDNGQMVMFNPGGGMNAGGGHGSEQFSSYYTGDSYGVKSMTRVAVIDKSARNVLGIEAGNSDQQSVTFDPGITTLESALAEQQLAAAEAEAAMTGIAPAKTAPLSALVPLAKPHVENKRALGPQVPKLTGDKGDFKTVPKSLQGTSANTLSVAIKKAIDEKDSIENLSGMRYAVGDSDYVEDMRYRTQIVHDVTTGKDHVEVQFRLLEDPVDKFSDQVVMPSSASLGGWEKTSIAPDQLVADDAISVRLSTKGVLKPDANQVVPNARVTGPGTQIGVNKEGFTIYRVPIAFANGNTGEIDLEHRISPSVPKFDFNPTKVEDQGGALQLTDDAQSQGWKVVADSVSYANAFQTKGGAGGLFVDERGVKLVDGKSYKPVSSYSAGGSDGKRVSKVLPSGALVEVNVAHTSKSTRTVNATSSVSSNHNSRRASANGEVSIRIPLDSDDVDRDLSAALEAVGIPPEKQGAPTEAEMARWAINTVHKQVAKTYKHGERPNATGLPGDAGTDQVLKEIEAAVDLGRPATLNDIVFYTDPMGRVSVMFSDDVAKAAQKKSGTTAFWHNPYSSDASGIVNMTSGALGGVMPSHERFSAGIQKSGQSPGPDNFNDAANRVFLRHSRTSTGSGVRIVYSPRMLYKMTGVYAREGDKYGARAQSNTLLYGNSNITEAMAKVRLDNDQIAYIVTGPYGHAETLKQLKNRGITQIGGRPIEQVVVENSPTLGDVSNFVPKLPGTEVPLGDLVAGVGTGGGAGAPAGGAPV